jgi:hypothetical protein
VPGIRRSAVERFSVIVQSETSGLTQEQILSALQEALDQAEKQNE